MTDRIITIGIFFISLTLLMFELVLIRLFSIVFLSDLSFLGISIALFGVSIGGICVYFIPDFFNRENFKSHLGLFSIMFALSIILFVLITFMINGTSFLSNYFLIILFYLVSTLPFALANICLTLVFKYRTKKINTVYFFDLLGAGLGVLGAILLLSFFSIENVLLIIFICSIAVALLYNFSRKKIIIGILIVLILVVLIIINQFSHFFTFNILHAKYHPAAYDKVFVEKTNSFSHIGIVSFKEENKTWENLEDAMVAERLVILIDGSAATPVYKYLGDDESMKKIFKMIQTFPFQVKEAGSSFIIGPGGGLDVYSAVLNGYKVKGVDINPIIVNDIMKGILKDYSGNIYGREGVDIVVSEGRSFINKDQSYYDVIDIPLVDTWASTIGGNLALVENYLYTVEAFRDYFDRLKEDGYLNIVRWEFDGKRLIPLFIEASKKYGVKDPSKNIVVVGEPDKISAQNCYMFKKNPFSAKEVEAISLVAKEHGFVIRYSPFTEGQGFYYSYLSAYAANDSSINTKKEATYDNRPFFFFGDGNTITIDFGARKNNNDGGLKSVFFIVSIFTILSLILPFLIKKKVKDLSVSKVRMFLLVLYFAALGIAFMFVEIVLVQKFILYLEQPIYSYSVVLAAILVFAGLGSLISKKFKKASLLTFLFTSIGIAIILISIILTYSMFINMTIGVQLWLKVLIAAGVSGIVALFMGVMMPLGFRWLDQYKLNELIPWGWAVNGALSVLATVVAMYLSIIYGFNFVLIMGIIFYGLAVLIIAIDIYFLKR